jgi:hypothetical protein
VGVTLHCRPREGGTHNPGVGDRAQALQRHHSNRNDTAYGSLAFAGTTKVSMHVTELPQPRAHRPALDPSRRAICGSVTTVRRRFFERHARKAALRAGQRNGPSTRGLR